MYSRYSSPNFSTRLASSLPLRGTSLRGFGGVLLIVRPGGGLFTWVSLLPLASALLMALYQLMTRRLAARDERIRALEEELARLHQA